MLDMRSTVMAYADPGRRVIGADFAHFLGLPMFALGGCSDSKAVDEQAAAEAALTLLTDALSGAHIVHDVGYLESGMTGSLAQLVICDEILDWIRHMVSPVEISEETLALGLIHELGPNGLFLESEHTFQHLRDRWYPRLFDRGRYETWLGEGGRTLRQRACERVDELLAEHQPEALPTEVRAQLREVTDRAEKELGKH